MFNEEQIREILNSKIEIYKQGEMKKKNPEFTEVYCDSVKYFNRISVHSQIDIFPEELFRERAPNQSEKEFNYIKATFKKPTTFPIWHRFKAAINRIWNDQNWSIKWSSNVPLTASTDTPQNYIEKEYPCYGSLESYYKSIVTPRKQEDANAVIGHKPFFIPIKVNGENEIVLDENQRVKPYACIYSSEQVWGFIDSLYSLVLLKEKSQIIHGNGKVNEGLVFEFYDDQNIWRIIQVGRKNEYQFQLFLYWNHALGYLPVTKLKGLPIQKENDILYQSHFFAAIDAMDDIILDESYLRTIKAGQAFPHKWEYVDDCDYHNEYGHCISGRIKMDRGEGVNEYDCPRCHGTGKSRSSSPLGVYQIKAPTRSDDSSKDIETPPFGWEAPNPDIMNFLRTEIDINELKALSVLSLTSSSKVKGSETALERMIDRDEQFSLISTISNQTFDLFEFSTKVILEMRYGTGVELPIITQPRNFAIRNEQDLTMEISQAKQNGLPDIAIRNLLLEYLQTRFNAQEEATKMINAAFYSDRLVSLSSLEVAQKKLSGAVSNWEDILHTSVYTFIAELIVDDPEFLNKDLETQRMALEEKAKIKDAEINPARLNPEQIIGNINAA